MLVLKLIMVIILLSMPVCVGAFCNRKNLIDMYVYGQLMMWAVFQILAVPMIHLRLPFLALVIVFMLAMLVMTVLGARKLPEIIKEFEKPSINPILIIALILILGQMAIYFFGMHLDEDDARWLAEANDAVAKNKMFLYNPATGEYMGSFRGEVIKDAFSPWSLYIALYAYVTGLNVSMMAHTVLAPVLLGLAYMVYHIMSKMLFKGKVEASVFLLSVAVINLFFAGNRHTQSVVTLTRIWQGKTVIAAVMIPLLFVVFLAIQEEDSIENWLWVAVAGCASCLFSGMGIAISLIMMAVLGGYTLITVNWKRIPLVLLAMIPSLVFGLGYYMMRVN